MNQTLKDAIKEVEALPEEEQRKSRRPCLSWLRASASTPGWRQPRPGVDKRLTKTSWQNFDRAMEARFVWLDSERLVDFPQSGGATTPISGRWSFVTTSSSTGSTSRRMK